jgi:hypothetical protein
MSPVLDFAFRFAIVGYFINCLFFKTVNFTYLDPSSCDLSNRNLLNWLLDKFFSHRPSYRTNMTVK